MCAEDNVTIIAFTLNSLQRRHEPNLRVLPAFVVNFVLKAALLVTLVDGLQLQHLGLVQQLMMKTERLFIFPKLCL